MISYEKFKDACRAMMRSLGKQILNIIIPKEMKHVAIEVTGMEKSFLEDYVTSGTITRHLISLRLTVVIALLKKSMPSLTHLGIVLICCIILCGNCLYLIYSIFSDTSVSSLYEWSVFLQGIFTILYSTVIDKISSYSFGLAKRLDLITHFKYLVSQESEFDEVVQNNPQAKQLWNEYILKYNTDTKEICAHLSTFYKSIEQLAILLAITNTKNEMDGAPE